MDSIYELLRENGIEIVLFDLEKNGYYDSELKIIFINRNLSEEEHKEVILHELGHALQHKEFAVLYKSAIYRSKMEKEATYYMLEHLIKESDGQFNYSDVFKKFKLGIGWEDKIN